MVFWLWFYLVFTFFIMVLLYVYSLRVCSFVWFLLVFFRVLIYYFTLFLCFYFTYVIFCVWRTISFCYIFSARLYSSKNTTMVWWYGVNEKVFFSIWGFIFVISLMLLIFIVKFSWYVVYTYNFEGFTNHKLRK